jgi:hypothetical protein
MSKPEMSVNDLEIQIETHAFTCYKFVDSPDNGFSSNLHLLLEAIEHSEKVKDENIKLIAKGILSSVMQHKIYKHDMEKEKQKLEEWRAKQAEKTTEN